MVDPMILLFESTATSFTTNGIGSLPDAASCIVVEERNGEFELEMEYPITGMRYGDIALRRILFVKPNPYSDAQPFRIYAISKPINGIVTVSAAHISYDLSGIPVEPFKVDSAAQAFNRMEVNAVTDCPFTFWTDVGGAKEMTVAKPTSIRALLGDAEGAVLDVYGGEYEFDKFTVKLHGSRGTNRGVSIRYGKNLTDLTQEENCSSVYTGVYPYWCSSKGTVIQLPEKIVQAEGTYDFTKIYPLDLSDSWQNKPKEERLREAAKTYMEENKIGVPTVSLEVSFAQLSQSGEYETLALLENVYLCDIVNVEFPELGVSATAQCVKTTYNVLTNQYDSIELGDAQSNLETTIANQSHQIDNTQSRIETFMDRAIENATQLITGGLGGYVIIRSSTGDGYPDEILVMDTDNIETAVNVWRWNKGGLGHSTTGYNGPYTTAITQDGRIVADFITAGTMQANRIKGGVLTLGGKENGSGELMVLDGNGNLLVTLNKDGLVLYQTDTDAKAVLCPDGFELYNMWGDKVLYFDSNTGTYRFMGTVNVRTKDGAQVIMGGDELSFYDNNGNRVLYFDSDAGTYRFVGELNVSDNFIVEKDGTVTIRKGEIDIGNNFHVDKDGNVTLGGNIVFTGNSSFTQVRYSTNRAAAIPNGWSETWNASWNNTSTEVWAIYSYNAGRTWTSPMLAQGKNGERGQNGSSGSDANVTFNNILSALQQAQNTKTTFITADTAGAPTIYGARIYGAEIYAGGVNNKGGQVISLNSNGISIRNGSKTNLKDVLEIYADGMTARLKTEFQGIELRSSSYITFNTPNVNFNHVNDVTGLYLRFGP